MSTAPASSVIPSREELAAALAAVMQRQLEQPMATPDWTYMESRLRPAQISRIVNAFERYRTHLPTQGRLLDFGCGMGADAFLARTACGGDLETFGGDVDDGSKFRLVRAASSMSYAQLSGATPALPYETGFFSVVIASGVIEHVAMDNETLKELHRVLAPEGVLIVTFLPNLLSYTEKLSQLTRHGYHERKYTLGGFRRQLLHLGFSPLEMGYHQLLPSGGSGVGGTWQKRMIDRLFSLDPYFERAAGLRAVSANVFAVARARSFFY